MWLTGISQAFIDVVDRQFVIGGLFGNQSLHARKLCFMHSM